MSVSKNRMSEYKPEPPDLSILDGRSDLQPLIEGMAAMIHDAWSAERMRNEWSYGPVRNDERKEHPSLKPYDELSEEDKELDRVTVRSSIAALLHLGYDVSK